MATSNLEKATPGHRHHPLDQIQVTDSRRTFHAGHSYIGFCRLTVEKVVPGIDCR
jgi:hypothetical protein